MNSSARAQDYLVSFGMPKNGDPMRATDEMFFNSTMQGATTNASHDMDLGALSAGKLRKFYLTSNLNLCNTDRSMVVEPEGIQLPNINARESKQSPFKGFLDISIVQQKLRKAVNQSADGHRGVYETQQPNSNRHTQNHTKMEVSNTDNMAVV